MSTWKIKVDILSVFFNRQETATRKPCFRKSMFIHYCFFYCCLGSPSVGLVVQFLVACWPHDITLKWREIWTAMIKFVFIYNSNIFADLIQGSGRTHGDREVLLGQPCSKYQKRPIVLRIYKGIHKNCFIWIEKSPLNPTKQRNNKSNGPLYHHGSYFSITSFNYFDYSFYKTTPVMQHDKTL